VVNAVLDALLAGEAVRVSGLGVFNVAARPAREGRDPRTGESIEIAARGSGLLEAGSQWICMGLFLSSGCFGLC
jgi:DNA-binding protein HU-beta